MNKEEENAARLRKERRTDVDFSKHELTITKQDLVTIHDFAKPDSGMFRITFTNINGILLVTGDCGNWMFSRGFIPWPTNFVSDGYWIEKLKAKSCQKPGEYDQKLTEEHIHDKINGELEEEGLEGEALENMIEFYTECLTHTDDGEYWYQHWVYDNLPDGLEAEDAPYCKDIKVQLKIVFDAFNICCDKVAELEVKNAKMQ